jgi:hypothetical protein
MKEIVRATMPDNRASINHLYYLPKELLSNPGQAFGSTTTWKMLRLLSQFHIASPTFLESIATLRESRNLYRFAAMPLCDNKCILYNQMVHILIHRSNVFRLFDFMTFISSRRRNKEILIRLPNAFQIWQIRNLITTLEHAMERSNLIENR